MEKEEALELVKAEAERIANENGLELVHVEMLGAKSGTTLRIFIDKPNGVSHGDCALLSSGLDQFLDERDPFGKAFVLEVSSPGIERGLYKLADFERFKGAKVKIKVREPQDGKRKFIGKLLGVEDGKIAVEEAKAKKILIDEESISKANLVMDFDSEIKKAKNRQK